MAKFKVGDRVIGIKGNKYCKKEIIGKVGTVICLRSWDFSVEFDEDINGHECSTNPEEHQGKKGHCWNCEEQEIELIHERKLNIEPSYEIY